MREKFPETNASTISTYLRYGYKGILHKDENGKFELINDDNDTFDKKYTSISTFDLLEKIMNELEEPASVEELYAICRKYKDVKYAAINGYLSTYRNKYIRLDDGKYILK